MPLPSHRGEPSFGLWLTVMHKYNAETGQAGKRIEKEKRKRVCELTTQKYSVSPSRRSPVCQCSYSLLFRNSVHMATKHYL